MADRYWVGGSGTWNSTSTTNWSASSGGGSGASAPTSADNVIFDANSNVGTGAFTVTVAGTSVAPSVCNDFSTGGAGGALDGAMTLTITATTGVLDIYGSMTLPATNFTFTTTTTSNLRFRATTTGKTITTNGVSIGANTVTFDGVGGQWTLGSAYTGTTTVLLVSNGSFVSGNFNITASALSASNSNIRSISLGSSSLTLSATGAVTLTTTTNLTWNAGTSTISCSGASPTFNGGGLTFNNVSFTSTAIATVTINGANTFNNLSFASRAASGIGTASFPISVTTTINGTLTFGSGTTGVARLNVGSSFIGINATISAATLTAMSDVDFRNITAAGASSPWSGTRIGNALGNSNITFTAARTVYWVSATSASWNGAVWNTTSGTAGGATTNFPLAQDTIVIDDAGLTAGNTITVNAGWNIPNLSFSTRSTAVTFATGTTNPIFYGDLTYSSAVTLTGTGIITFYPQSKTATITSAGVTFTQPINLNMPLGTLRINGDLITGSTRTTTLFAGTLDLTNNGAGNFTLSTGLFNSSNSNTRTIAFGTGNITVTGNNAIVWTNAVATGFTYTGTPNLNFSYAGATGTRTVVSNSTGQVEENAVNFNFTDGTDIIAFTGNCRMKNLNFTGFSGTLNNSACLTFGNVTYSAGMTLNAGTSQLSFTATSGTQLITTNGKTLDFPITQNGVGGTVQLQDNLTIGSTRTYTLTAGALNLNTKTLTTGIFSSSNSNTRTISFANGTIVIADSGTAWNTATSTNLTLSGVGTISMTSASAKTFAGGSKVYSTLNQGGTGDLSITGTNTFSNITNTAQPATITFPASTITTVLNMTLAGLAGSLITINSSIAGTQATLYNPNATTISVNYCSIVDNNATGGTRWSAYYVNGNIDAGNNTGWIWIAPLQANNLTYADFVRVTIPATGTSPLTVYRFASTPSAITVPAIDSQPFSALGVLMKVGDTQKDIKSTANETNFTLVGIDTAMLGWVLGNQIKGSQIEAWKGFFDANGALITDIGIGGLLQFFNGYINSFAINETWMEELRQFVGVISVSASSIQLILKNRTAGRYTNDNNWQFFAPNDTSMDRVAFITNINYNFGKGASPNS